VGIHAHLHLNGQPIAGLEDPSGGHFDAAGDFDRLIPNAEFPTLSKVDVFGDLELRPVAMPALIAEIDKLSPTGRPGPEQRGLLRLRALAEKCAETPASVLVFHGD
jgi:hypothetical protein